jgi:hypothetical protein
MDLKIKKVGFRIPCPTYLCRNTVQYAFNIDRGPAATDIQLCEDCLRSLVRNSLKHFEESPDDKIAELKARIEELEIQQGSKEKLEVDNKAKIADLEEYIEKMKAEFKQEIKENPDLPTQNLGEQPKTEQQVIPKTVPADARCSTCKHQFSKKDIDPCKTCKVDHENGKGYTAYKARE